MTSVKADIEQVTEKFNQAFDKYTNTIKKGEYSTGFEIFTHILNEFKDEDILTFLPRMSICFNKKDNIKLYHTAVDVWTKSIIETHEKMIKDVMTAQSISLGEAIIVADRFLNKHIGYHSTFLWTLYVTFQETLKYNLKAMESD